MSAPRALIVMGSGETAPTMIERLLALRAELRAERAWQLADRLRDRMIAAGIELRDTADGTTWSLRP